MTLSELIEALEKATGPDRELDYYIHTMLNEGNILKTYKSLEKWVGQALKNKWATARYTSSLDAALTLVPEGWRWKIQERIAGDSVAAVIERQAPDFSDPAVKASEAEERASSNVRYGISAFAPIALCIAALKALQSLGSGK